ncbi:MAG: putative DNA binding domain-containing protein [Burkholderiales bacterium]|nr:putative DNA binding domain-containing protein [Burkholderiales bacterium]
MTLERTNEYLISLLHELIKLPQETEWLEFKTNKAQPKDIGEYISALSNSAALKGKSHGYMIWGVDDDSHEIVGTIFDPFVGKIGNEELINWLIQRLSPRIYFCFYSVDYNGKSVIILEINSANNTPVKFTHTEFIRIGSYKKPLHDHPEVAKTLWRILDQTPFELQPAAELVTEDEILQLLDYPAFFDLINLSLPENRNGIISRLADERLIIATAITGKWTITNLGAILFAKKLKQFRHLERKSVRVILYQGNSRLETIKEFELNKGYASGFAGLIEFINSQLPHNEVIGAALRKSVLMYPELAVRELVANAIIHQDLTITGAGPMIEIFANRLEITNPGAPIVDVIRFLDTPPRSRNELMAAFMRRIGICEERDSGIDKVVFQTEVYQLPAPLFAVIDDNTKAVLFSHKIYNEMETHERAMACYLHCCLKYVNHESMNNASLRARFGIKDGNSAIVSRIIKQAIEDGLIRLHDPLANRKSWRYVPFWA